MNPSESLDEPLCERVLTPEQREGALGVLRETYCLEKLWVRDESRVFPLNDLLDPSISWFIVSIHGRPAGVLRVLYDPPIHLYATYGLKPVVPGTDILSFVQGRRVAEIGRFAVLPDHRKLVRLAAALMRSAVRETLEREYTHYITDVFEGERHSPLNFHTRVMGFVPVATHDTGELNCPNRRITLVLDLREGYRRLRKSQSWLYRFLTENWHPGLHESMRGGPKARSLEPSWNLDQSGPVAIENREVSWDDKSDSVFELNAAGAVAANSAQVH